ncbi:hypothetical protein L9F63_025567, partial [Diploptera punctata]
LEMVYLNCVRLAFRLEMEYLNCVTLTIRLVFHILEFKNGDGVFKSCYASFRLDGVCLPQDGDGDGVGLSQDGVLNLRYVGVGDGYGVLNLRYVSFRLDDGVLKLRWSHLNCVRLGVQYLNCV